MSLSSAEQWRWTDDEGVQRLLLGDELRVALREGRLKPGTLVWRRGMRNWLPASEVPELATDLSAAPVIAAPRVGEIGRVAAPTPSIPPLVDRPEKSPSGRPMPQNMIDIGALRAQAVATGRASDDDATGIPTAPRIPASLGMPGPRSRLPATMVSARPRTTGVDGLWSKDNTENTTTTTLIREPDPRPPGAKSPMRGARARSAIDNPVTSDTETHPRGARGAAGTPVTEGEALPRPAVGLQGSAGRPATRPPPAPPHRHAPSTRPPPPPHGRRGPVPPKLGSTTPQPSGKRTMPPPPPAHRMGARTAGRKADSPFSTTLIGTRASSLGFPKPAGGLAPMPPTEPAAEPHGPAEPPLRAGVPIMTPTVGLEPGPEGSSLPAATHAPGEGPVFAGAAASVEVPAGPRTEPPAPHPPAATAGTQDLSYTGPLPDLLTPTPSGSGNALIAALASTPAPVGGMSAASPPPTEPAVDGAPPADREPAAAMASADVAPQEPTVERNAATQVAMIPGTNMPVHPRLISVPPPSARPEPPLVDAPPSGPFLSRRSLRLPRRTLPLLGAGALFLLLFAFVVGRATAPDDEDITVARSGLAALPLLRRSPAAGPAQSPRPCLMLRAPARWATSAVTRVPTEITALSSGLFAVGFGRADDAASGITVSPATGEIEVVFQPDPIKGSLARVVPYEADHELRFGVTQNEGKLRSSIFVPTATPLYAGFTDTQFATATSEGGPPSPLWPLGDEAYTPSALRAVPVAGRGIGITYRLSGPKGKADKPWQIVFAWLGPDGAVAQSPAAVASAAILGTPVIADNGSEVALVYAEKTEAHAPSQIRWSHAPLGQPLQAPELVPIPPGGPGGDIIAPSIAGLADGRWVLLWTEGTEKRMLRAQTYAADFSALGNALQVSPATGDFGQGSVGVVEESATVAFLLKTDKGFELWGTMLQCR